LLIASNFSWVFNLAHAAANLCNQFPHRHHRKRGNASIVCYYFLLLSSLSQGPRICWPDSRWAGEGRTRFFRGRYRDNMPINMTYFPPNRMRVLLSGGGTGAEPPWRASGQPREGGLRLLPGNHVFAWRAASKMVRDHGSRPPGQQTSRQFVHWLCLTLLCINI
jgi:hypothetical protein